METNWKTEIEGKLGAATYCPEDNKLRLYVGRVPRDEYEALRAEGWTSTPKQPCDFVAVWTPQREDTALAYAAGVIDDEDMDPGERAADRAERFQGYQGRRIDDAQGHADRYDGQDTAHGFQSAEKAERAAARHDRIADRAVNAWGKAEYWQRRTEGVVAHALYVSAPSVRMGRIKGLESDLRRHEGSGGRWEAHLRLRLAYERQMMEAQGGRAGELEIEPGGWVIGRRFWQKAHGWRQVLKVNRSNVTGRVVSVTCRFPGDRWGNTSEGSHLANVEIERASPECYRAPTDEERAAFVAMLAAEKAERKEAKAGAPVIPFVNLTDADAERLQNVWNDHNKAHWSGLDDKPKAVCRMTQAEYSARAKGTYGAAETVCITGGGTIRRDRRNLADFPTVAKVREHNGRVVILSDKPQKALPATVWEDPRPAAKAAASARLPELADALRGLRWLSEISEAGRVLLDDARRVGLAFADSECQYGLTEEGQTILRASGYYSKPEPVTA